MGLRHAFGPSRDEIWEQIARDIGGTLEKDSFLGGEALRYHAGEWEITLDTRTEVAGYATMTLTRMRAPFVNKDGFYFRIYRERIFSAIGKRLGLQDIAIGDPYFDDEFIVQANDKEKVKLLLSSPRLKELLEAQPDVYFEVRDDEGWFGARFPKGVDELYFQCSGILKEERLLRDLFEVFTLVLERLVQIDSAYEKDPGVKL